MSYLLPFWACKVVMEYFSELHDQIVGITTNAGRVTANGTKILAAESEVSFYIFHFKKPHKLLNTLQIFSGECSGEENGTAFSTDVRNVLLMAIVLVTLFVQTTIAGTGTPRRSPKSITITTTTIEIASAIEDVDVDGVAIIMIMITIVEEAFKIDHNHNLYC